jgi:hypothetical protein
MSSICRQSWRVPSSLHGDGEGTRPPVHEYRRVGQGEGLERRTRAGTDPLLRDRHRLDDAHRVGTDPGQLPGRLRRGGQRQRGTGGHAAGRRPATAPAAGRLSRRLSSRLSRLRLPAAAPTAGARAGRLSHRPVHSGLVRSGLVRSGLVRCGPVRRRWLRGRGRLRRQPHADPGDDPRRHARVVDPGREVAGTFLLRVERPDQQPVVLREGHLHDAGRLEHRVRIGDREPRIVRRTDAEARARQPGRVRLRRGDFEHQAGVDLCATGGGRRQYPTGDLGGRVHADRQRLAGDSLAYRVEIRVLRRQQRHPQRPVDRPVGRVTQVHHRVGLAGRRRIQGHGLVEGEHVGACRDEGLVDQLVPRPGVGIHRRLRLLVVHRRRHRQHRQRRRGLERHLTRPHLGTGGDRERRRQRAPLVGKGHQPDARRRRLQ